MYVRMYVCLYRAQKADNLVSYDCPRSANVYIQNT